MRKFYVIKIKTKRARQILLLPLLLNILGYCVTLHSHFMRFFSGNKASCKEHVSITQIHEQKWQFFYQTLMTSVLPQELENLVWCVIVLMNDLINVSYLYLLSGNYKQCLSNNYPQQKILNSKNYLVKGGIHKPCGQPWGGGGLVKCPLY